ncbi:MAG TPA: hypothetical protein VHX88_14165 [Solirubrobacteraceae bacterium]|nr:hypothetical protein [Solirubrobacteraceae bacterium]
MSLPAERPAFYAMPGRGWRALLTLLHPPYTAMHLSYFALGAAVAPHLHGSRLGWGLAAFLLAVGVSAHALDELHGHPLSTGLSDRTLIALASLGLLGALAIGVAGILTVTVGLLPFVFAGPLLVVAYNLELAGGRFHSDLWFALAGGAFPALTGYFADAQRITLSAVLIAAACLATSFVQRRLSTAARELRRRTATVEGVRVRKDGSRETLSVASLLTPLEGALSALWVAVVLTASALVASRL